MESNQVNVLGWYNHGNVGDEAYKMAFTKLFPDNQFNFLEGLHSSTESCILGGGDVLSGYFLKHIKHSAKKIGISITVNPDTNTKEDVKQFEHLYVRDHASFHAAKNLGANPVYIPDLTFCLTPNKENGKNIIQKLFAKNNLDLYENVIGITINSNIAPTNICSARDYIDFEHFCEDLADFLDNYNASFVFIPFCTGMPNDDRVSNGKVATQCKFWKKNLLMFDELSVQDTLDVVASCDTMISTRLHASIFSCISGVHFVDITHNHKNKSFLESIQYNCTIPYREFNKLLLEKQLNISEENKKILINKIQNIYHNQYNLLYEVKKSVHLL